MNKFAINIKILRKNRGLNQADMEKELGFTQARWSSYEAQVAYPSLDDFIRIAAYFGVTETELLHSDIEPNKRTSAPKKGLIKIDEKRNYNDNNSSKKGRLIKINESRKYNDDTDTLKNLIAYQQKEIADLRRQVKKK